VTLLAIINPEAGRRTGLRTWLRLRAEAADVTRDWARVMTRYRGHATVLARAAATTRRYERVVVFGGDGTVSEVAAGLADSETPLGIIPVGTGNDAARNLAIPRNPIAAARLAATGSPRAIDLGRVETFAMSRSVSYFVNVAGLGFDAEAAWRVNRLSRLVGGTLPYVVGTLHTLWQYAAPRVRVSLDDQVIVLPLFMIAVGNCAAYAGGMRIVPTARPDDGAFDVCLVHALPRLEVLRMIPRLYSGGHVSHPSVKLIRCRTLAAEVLNSNDRGPRRVFCHADGQQVGCLPARFAIRPAALRCVTGSLPGSAA
jgi:YegS/Rv2252/BmrU family lipid kinase